MKTSRKCSYYKPALNDEDFKKFANKVVDDYSVHWGIVNTMSQKDLVQSRDGIVKAMQDHVDMLRKVFDEMIYMREFIKTVQEERDLMFEDNTQLFARLQELDAMQE